MARRGGGGGGGCGSAVVMMVFLIFFILLSIGLGVSTYLGFSQDDDKAGKLKKKEQEFADMEKEAEWNKFQAQTYRVAMGQKQGIDEAKLADMRDRFEKGTLIPPVTKKEEAGEVKTLITTLNSKQRLDWDEAQKRWKLTYEELLAAERKKTEQAVAASNNFQTQQEEAKKRADKADEDLRETKDAHVKAYLALEEKSKEDLKSYLTKIAELEKQKDELSAQVSARVTANEGEKLLQAKKEKEKEEVIAGLRKQLAVKSDQLDNLKRELGRDVPVEIQLEWRVSQIDARGETAYINLGSADKVQPLLTFRVHGIGPDGRPNPKDKATLEVVRVLGDHLSQAKILYVTTPRENPRHDPTHNPVVKGDVIINPSWNPNQKKHIALAGVVDLTGSGRDETAAFVRSLEKQGIVVDSYLDLRKDFTIKGPGITVQTDYLILGERPQDILGVAQGPGKDIKDKIDAGMLEMQKQAKDNGVRIKGLRQFLEEIGYRIPGNTESKAPSIDLRGGGEQPPQVPKDPMMKDDKPLPPPPADK